MLFSDSRYFRKYKLLFLRTKLHAQSVKLFRSQKKRTDMLLQATRDTQHEQRRKGSSRRVGNLLYSHSNRNRIPSVNGKKIIFQRIMR